MFGKETTVGDIVDINKAVIAHWELTVKNAEVRAAWEPSENVKANWFLI